ncbi:hypothetical protein [Pseudonocardia sp. GCM10023141]|uniref:hypothetical protein n=1 Tax=Pseudonocardia sp. GCM10023141 TaxID=3252653 RepID=UPI003621E9D7
MTYPIPLEERYASPATFTRIKNGETLPTLAEFERLAHHMRAPDSSALGAPDKASPRELPSELADGLGAAHEVPWSIRAQLASRATAAAAAALQLATAVAAVDQLQSEIIDLELALAAVAAGSAGELRLRGELDLANTWLREAVARHRRDATELVACAVALSGAVTAYLDHVNASSLATGRAPGTGLRPTGLRPTGLGPTGLGPTGLRRGPVAVPKGSRRAVAGHRRVGRPDRRRTRTDGVAQCRSTFSARARPVRRAC